MRSPLPLKEVIVQRDGAAQPMLALVPEKAVADDAGLAARAVRYQFEPGFQQVFEHHYRQFLKQVRTTSIPDAASSADLQRALNPDREPRLTAALAAAAGSRRYEQAVAELRGEPSDIGYTMLVGRGGQPGR